jgi:hypothetical protein
MVVSFKGVYLVVTVFVATRFPFQVPSLWKRIGQALCQSAGLRLGCRAFWTDMPQQADVQTCADPTGRSILHTDCTIERFFADEA